MDTLESKRQTVQSKISLLEDENLLDEINDILNSKTTNDYFVLSDIERKRADFARKQYLERTLIPNNIVKEKAEKWLKSK